MTTPDKSASDALAEACRRAIARHDIYSASPVSAALRRYDAEADVRAAEREFIEAVVAEKILSRGDTSDLLKFHNELVPIQIAKDKSLGRLLAAREKKGTT